MGVFFTQKVGLFWRQSQSLSYRKGLWDYGIMGFAVRVFFFLSKEIMKFKQVCRTGFSTQRDYEVCRTGFSTRRDYQVCCTGFSTRRDYQVCHTGLPEGIMRFAVQGFKGLSSLPYGVFDPKGLWGLRYVLFDPKGLSSLPWDYDVCCKLKSCLAYLSKEIIKFVIGCFWLKRD